MYAAHAQTPNQGDTFIDLVDFKWLMAGVGWWVDLSRLQSDGAYIDECLQLSTTRSSRRCRSWHWNRSRIHVLTLSAQRSGRGLLSVEPVASAPGRQG